VEPEAAVTAPAVEPEAAVTAPGEA